MIVSRTSIRIHSMRLRNKKRKSLPTKKVNIKLADFKFLDDCTGIEFDCYNYKCIFFFLIIVFCFVLYISKLHFLRFNHRTDLRNFLPYQRATSDVQKHVTDIAKRTEALTVASLAVSKASSGQIEKADRLFMHALRLDPRNSEVLIEYGEFFEKFKKNLIQADHLYTRALLHSPQHKRALQKQRYIRPMVEELDRRYLATIDGLLSKLYEIPADNPGIRSAQREAYFLHIFHSNAIEGNTLTLMQTRYIIETRMAIGGKHLLEQQEVLGMDAALHYLNHSLLCKNGSIRFDDLVALHRRLLGFVNPVEAGQIRTHQVFVGSFQPPPPNKLATEIAAFDDWLRSFETMGLHAIEAAAIAHYRFVYIHPFFDGNGRIGRLLMNLILMRAGYPPVIINSEDRLDYYHCLAIANDGDIRPFIRFIASQAEDSINFYLKIFEGNSTIPVPTIDTRDWDDIVLVKP